MSTLTQALAHAQTLGLPRAEAGMLLLHVLGRPLHERAWLVAHDSDALPPDISARFETLLSRRMNGEPIAYLTGRKPFYGLDLAVDARVLDPRDDTETLVDWALDLCSPAPRSVPWRLLDLGTGSGAIALALCSQRPAAEVTAIDRSEDALAVAAANARQLNLPLRLLAGNWFAPVQGERFDLIASNPPYIAESDPHLPALIHEPRAALVSGPDGLADIRHLIAHAPAHLLPGGWLLLEHGWDQAGAVRALLAANGFGQVQSRCDLAGIERCSGGRMAA
ncbi:peptide chain release factor N(5)-glutamine methyltransferase [Ottowia sp. VDI28]|uniref:peptide chain release factor N(5)-glutamine methyltransferase n=1 Tax=Ottowia sp. VDI28 TaxID=3133968 RepID=UPI003C2CF26D